MNLNGKTIAFLGDSITEAYGIANQDDNYVNVLAKKYHFTALNYGMGGTRYAKQLHHPVGPFDSFDFNRRILSVNSKSDIVVIFGGSNDYGHGDAPFGTADDKTENTFCGAVNGLAKKCRKRFPHAIIIFVTPLHRLNDMKIGHDAWKDPDSKPLANYASHIKNVAIKNKIQCLDLFSICRIDPNNPSDAAEYMPDGLHPNEKGHLVIANLLGHFLESLD
jgi:lysophospholipase L1-like esterase